MSSLEISISSLFTIVAATLLFALLISFVIYFILLYRKSQNKLIVERERIKQELLRIENEVKEQTLVTVSRELHDNLGQIASLIMINLNMMSKSLMKDDLERVDDSLELIKRLITDIKALSKSLNGERLKKLGWINTIKEDIERINALGGMQIEFEQGGKFKLQHDTSVILYRITQEILNNALKHAKSFRGQLFIRCERKHVQLKFSDDGIGFDVHNGKARIRVDEYRRTVSDDWRNTQAG